jgi:hypothetical protein
MSEPNCHACSEESIDRCECCNRPVCIRHSIDDAEATAVKYCEPCAEAMAPKPPGPPLPVPAGERTACKPVPLYERSGMMWEAQTEAIRQGRLGALRDAQDAIIDAETLEEAREKIARLERRTESNPFTGEVESGC